MTDVTKMSFHCPDCGADISEGCVRCSYCNSVLTSTSCPACFGPVFKGMKFCSSCGVSVERTELKSDKPLKCPRCEHTLSPAQIGNSRIDECTYCGGIWLDSATFQKICDENEHQTNAYINKQAAIDLKIVDKPERMYVPCPECCELMTRKNFAGCSGIIVDLCRPHGTWFDRKELQQIVNFIRTGGLDRARLADIERLQAEQRHLDNMKFNQSMESLCQSEISLNQEKDNDSLLLDVISSIGKLLS